MTANDFQILLLLTGLLLAVWLDHRHHRIPNMLTGTLLLAGLGVQTASAGLPGLGMAVAGALIGFLVFLPPYVMRGMAAGDVKLMAAVGACIGPAQALSAACLSLICGGALAVLVVMYRFYQNSSTTLNAVVTSRFPYASAIALGAAASFALQEISWTP